MHPRTARSAARFPRTAPRRAAVTTGRPTHPTRGSGHARGITIAARSREGDPASKTFQVGSRCARSRAPASCRASRRVRSGARRFMSRICTRPASKIRGPYTTKKIVENQSLRRVDAARGRGPERFRAPTTREPVRDVVHQVLHAPAEVYLPQHVGVLLELGGALRRGLLQPVRCGRDVVHEPVAHEPDRAD